MRQVILTVAVAVSCALAPSAWAGEAVADLMKILTDAETPQDKRLAARNGLVQIGAASVGELIRVGKATEDESIRLHCLIALWEIKDSDAVSAAAVPWFLQLLTDKSFPIKYWAIRNLARLSDEYAIPGLTDVLKDKDPLLRRAAVVAIGQSNPVKAAAAFVPLMALLKDFDPYVLSATADSLALLGATEAVDPLLDLLMHDSIIVRNSTAAAVGKLSGRPLMFKPTDTDEEREDKIEKWKERR